MSDNEKPVIPAMMEVPKLAEPVIFTEVKVRQFFRTLDGGQEAIPATVFFLENGVSDVSIEQLAAKMTDAVRKQLAGSVRPMSREEITAFVMTEITAFSIAAANARGSLIAIPEGDGIPPLTLGKEES